MWKGLIYSRDLGIRGPRLYLPRPSAVCGGLCTPVRLGHGKGLGDIHRYARRPRGAGLGVAPYPSVAGRLAASRADSAWLAAAQRCAAGLPASLAMVAAAHAASIAASAALTAASVAVAMSASVAICVSPCLCVNRYATIPQSSRRVKRYRALELCVACMEGLR